MTSHVMIFDIDEIIAWRNIYLGDNNIVETIRMDYIYNSWINGERQKKLKFCMKDVPYVTKLKQIYFR